MTIKPYIPTYHKVPNVFLRYELRKFHVDTSNGVLTGTERVAIFIDKNKKEQEMCAQVIWDNL